MLHASVNPSLDVLPKLESDLPVLAPIQVEDSEVPSTLNLPYLETVFPPNSSSEAQLLLDSARAECKLYKIRKELVDQLVQCNQLRLEHNLLQVKRAEKDLLSAELHVGWAWLVIRRYGYT